MAFKIKDSPFLPVYGYALVLLGFMSIHPGSLLKLQRKNDLLAIIFSDYTFHFLGFGLLAWLLCRGFRRAKKGQAPYLLVGMISVAYGFFIEVCQIFVPYRTFGIDDLAADAAGALVALGLHFAFFNKPKM